MGILIGSIILLMGACSYSYIFNKKFVYAMPLFILSLITFLYVFGLFTILNIGVFVAVGTIPNSGIVKEFVELDDYGYIKTDVNMETSVKGIFAIGDVRNTVLRQIVTACADGAIAAHNVEKFLEE